MSSLRTVVRMKLTGPKEPERDHVKIPVPARVSQNKRLRAIEARHKSVLETFNTFSESLKKASEENRKRAKELLAPIREQAEADADRLFGVSDTVSSEDSEDDFI